LKKDLEVILLDDPIDEFCFQHLTEFQKKKLVNVGKGEFKLPEDDESTRKKQKKIKKIYSPLTEWWGNLQPETLEKVVIS
jgi:HSP90 family molecular chaperone